MKRTKLIQWTMAIVLGTTVGIVLAREGTSTSSVGVEGGVVDCAAGDPACVDTARCALVPDSKSPSCNVGNTRVYEVGTPYCKAIGQNASCDRVPPSFVCAETYTCSLGFDPHGNIICATGKIATPVWALSINCQ